MVSDGKAKLAVSHVQCNGIGKLLIACALFTIVCLPKVDADMSEYILRYVESVPKIVAEYPKEKVW